MSATTRMRVLGLEHTAQQESGPSQFGPLLPAPVAEGKGHPTVPHHGSEETFETGGTGVVTARPVLGVILHVSRKQWAVDALLGGIDQVQLGSDVGQGPVGNRCPRLD